MSSSLVLLGFCECFCARVGVEKMALCPSTMRTFSMMSGGFTRKEPVGRNLRYDWLGKFYVG